MRHRLIFPAIARVERRDRIAKAHKIGDETQTEREDLGWFLVVTLGFSKEFAFSCGPEKPNLISPTINLILEYQVPDAESSPTPVV